MRSAFGNLYTPSNGPTEAKASLVTEPAAATRDDLDRNLEFYSQRRTNGPTEAKASLVAEPAAATRDDLDRNLEFSFSPPMPLSLPPSSFCLLKYCATCAKIFQGPWLACEKCGGVFCLSCQEKQPTAFCFFAMAPHTMKMEHCAACPIDAVTPPSRVTPQWPSPAQLFPFEPPTLTVYSPSDLPEPACMKILLEGRGLPALPIESPRNRVRREVPDVPDMAATIAREHSDVHWRRLGGPPTGELKAPKTARRYVSYWRLCDSQDISINTHTRSIYPESSLSSLSSLLPHGTQLRTASLASAVHGVDEDELSEDGSDGSSVSLTSTGTLGDEDWESKSSASFVKSVASWDDEAEEESDASSASLLSASSSEDEDSESSWGEDSEEESDASSASLASISLGVQNVLGEFP
ncbi:hypothetical protein B0H13DRAFT_2542269 [Mycena leptocephala]|nr:hypothetical protein B0H13DRAFT_2542269 [Mycena leptocephala]